LKAGSALLSLPNIRFVDVTAPIIIRAQDLVDKYRLKPRDAIHAATALVVGECEIASDEEFDKAKELKRILLI